MFFLKQNTLKKNHKVIGGNVELRASDFEVLSFAFREKVWKAITTTLQKEVGKSAPPKCSPRTKTAKMATSPENLVNLPIWATSVNIF